MPNLYAQLKALLDPGPMQIGQVSSYEDGVATVDLHGGGQLRARGQATLGGKVFVRDGVILGPAPDLPVIVDVI